MVQETIGNQALLHELWSSLVVSYDINGDAIECEKNVSSIGGSLAKKNGKNEEFIIIHQTEKKTRCLVSKKSKNGSLSQ